MAKEEVQADAAQSEGPAELPEIWRQRNVKSCTGTERIKVRAEVKRVKMRVGRAQSQDCVVRLGTNDSWCGE